MELIAEEESLCLALIEPGRDERAPSPHGADRLVERPRRPGALERDRDPLGAVLPLERDRDVDLRARLDGAKAEALRDLEPARDSVDDVDGRGARRSRDLRGQQP